MNNPLAKKALAEAERIQKLGYYTPAHEMRQKAYDVERLAQEIEFSKRTRRKKAGS